MTRWTRSRVLPGAMALLLAVALASCGKPPARPVEKVTVAFHTTLPPDLVAADVNRVQVTVSGPGIATPLEFTLTRAVPAEAAGGRVRSSADPAEPGDNRWEGTLEGIPAGDERVFTVSAYGTDDVLLFRGASEPVSLTSGGTDAPTAVAVPAATARPPPPGSNSAPAIRTLVAAPLRVEPGQDVKLSVVARDPDVGDTITHAWEAPAGSFSTPTEPSTVWTAPVAPGVYPLRVRVTDSHGLFTTASVDVTVPVPGVSGSAAVTVTFNTSPRVDALSASPSQLSVGQSVQLVLAATDPDGDALAYAWASDCAGAFGDPHASATSFRLDAAPPAGQEGCALSVTVDDGRGAQQSGTLSLPVDPQADVRYGPELQAPFQSHPSARAGETVTLQISARDPDGEGLTFAWEATGGVLSPQESTATSSLVRWTAPACFDAPRAVTATVVDVQGLTSSHTFTVQPGDVTACSP